MAREASPLEALVGVIAQGEGGDDQLAGHAAELPAEPLHVLADALVPGTDNTEELDQELSSRAERLRQATLPRLSVTLGEDGPLRGLVFPEAMRPSGS